MLGLLLQRLVRTARSRRCSLLTTGAALLVGFVSVFFSPGSRNRQQLIQDRSMLDPALIGTTLGNWWAVVTTVVPSAGFVLLALGALVVGLVAVEVPSGRSRRWWLLATAGPLVWAVLCSVAATYVLSYSFNGQLVGRERTWPSITITLLVASAWLLLLAGGRSAPACAPAPGRRSSWSRPRFSARSPYRRPGSSRCRCATSPTAWSCEPTRPTSATPGSGRRSPRAPDHRVLPVPIDGLYEPFYPNRRPAWPLQCVPGFYGVEDVQMAPLPWP